MYTVGSGDARSVEKRVYRAAEPVVGDLRWQDCSPRDGQTKDGVQYEVKDSQGQLYTETRCVIKEGLWGT